MAAASKVPSLTNYLDEILNPAPVFKDPEDEFNVGVAQVVEKDAEWTNEEEEETSAKSRLRIGNAAAAVSLTQDDETYAGKVITRKKLGGNEEKPAKGVIGVTDSDAESSNEENVDSDTNDESVTSEESNDVDDDDDDDDDDNDIDEQEDESLGDNQTIVGKGEMDDPNDYSSVINTFSEVHLNEDLNKAKSTKNQIKLCDQLLELRIKLQKGLQVVNCLPPFDVWNDFMIHCDKDAHDIHKQGINHIEELLNKLIHLQIILFNGNDATKGIMESNAFNFSSAFGSESQNVSEPQSLKREHSLEKYSSFLAEQHTAFKTYRNSTINKWNDRTRLSAGKINAFAGFEHNVVDQIEQILLDKQRLIHRTQIRRNVFDILGERSKTQLDPEPENSHIQLESKKLQQHNEEIFNDDDFYHELLKEVIDRSTGTQDADNVTLGRQWLEIQKIRTKMKKPVDTKASKGRKLRYETQKKLINFMAPVDDTTMSAESKNYLFNSLFGKNASRFSSK